MDAKKRSQGPWTWDFTIITMGSVISLLGGVMSSFAMSIIVLDYTGSAFLGGQKDAVGSPVEEVEKYIGRCSHSLEAENSLGRHRGSPA